MPAALKTRIDPEQVARKLQLEMWDRQVTLWGGLPVTPMDVCDPWIAGKHLGFTVQEGYLTHPSMLPGQLGGFLNRVAKVIAVSDSQSRRTQLFTLSHEVGHLLMHPGMHHHREMPIHGLTEPRKPVELEEWQANQFAGFFLVPTKQLKLAFQACFRVERLRLTDDVAWELLPGNYTSLMNSPPYSDAFHRVVAQADHFNGNKFDPLCVLFNVSPMTMAIRLREAGLVTR